MKIAIRQSQKINSRIHNSRIAIRQRIAQLGHNLTSTICFKVAYNCQSNVQENSKYGQKTGKM